MSELYLAASEMAFGEQGTMRFQMQMPERQDVVPDTRDFIVREDVRLRERERGVPVPMRLAGEWQKPKGERQC